MNEAIQNKIRAAAQTACDCIADKRGAENSTDFEGWAFIVKALEDAELSEKNLKDLKKELWSAVKEENEDGVSAYAGELYHTALAVAAAWTLVAAEAQRIINA